MNKLREAAQAVIDRWESPNWTHDAPHTGALIAALREALREDALVCLSETHQQLDEALETLNLDSFASFYPGEFEEDKEAEEQEEYELIGCIDGTYGGRWMLAAFAENASAVWPDGTAIYVRRGQE